MWMDQRIDVVVPKIHDTSFGIRLELNRRDSSMSAASKVDMERGKSLLPMLMERFMVKTSMLGTTHCSILATVTSLSFLPT